MTTDTHNALHLLEEHRSLVKRCLESVDADRDELARELHDELGQFLVAIKTVAGGLVRSSPINEQTTLESAKRIVNMVDAAFIALDRVIYRLRPVILDETGLFGALEQLVASWREIYPDILIHLEPCDDLTAIENNIQIVIYRLAQECLTNIAKHANAKKVDIIIRIIDADTEQAYVNFIVRDDGLGINLSEERHSRFGLRGMRERVELIPGAVFSLDSAPGCGTSISALIPTSLGK